MEIILHESKRIPYVRNMFLFQSGIYFNTYIRKNPKPGDTIYQLDLGIFKIQPGSEVIAKITSVEVENYSIIDEEIFYYIDGKTFSYNPDSQKIKPYKKFAGVNFNYITNQTFFQLVNSDGQINRQNSLIYYHDTGYKEFNRTGYVNNKFVLSGPFLSINEFDCYNANGEKKWSLKVSDELDISEDRMVWRKNHIQKIYPIKDYWIVYYNDRTVLKLDANTGVGWYKIESDYHTYTYQGDFLYGLSDHVLSKINAKTGEVILSENISKTKEKYNSPLYQGGAWIYENYIFFPSPKRSSIEWLVFDKNTLKEVGHMKINLGEDEIVRIPGQFCSNFIFSNNKVYLNDTADWLRVYNVEFKV